MRSLSVFFFLVLLQICEECGLMLSSKSGVCVKWKFHFLCSCQNRGRSGSKLSAVKVESERFQKCHNRGLWRILSRWKLPVCHSSCKTNQFLDLWLNCLVSRYREGEDCCYVFFVIIVNLRLLFISFWTGVHLAIEVIKSWRRIPRRWRALVVGKYP